MSEENQEQQDELRYLKEDVIPWIRRELDASKRDLAQASEVVLHLAKHRDILKAMLDEAKTEIAAITSDRDKEAERINKLESAVNTASIFLTIEAGRVSVAYFNGYCDAPDLREAIDILSL